MHYRQKGFNTVITLILVGGLLFVAFVGWLAYQSQSTQNTAAATPKRIVALGDMVCDPDRIMPNDDKYCQHAAVASRTQRLRPDAILALGDLQYENATLQKFQMAFDKVWGSQKNIMYPTPGNHEYNVAGASGYYTYFQDAPLDVSKGYYSFTLGGWHIMSLNTNCEHIEGCWEDSEQINWLEQELRKNTAACTLAFWHHPRFTSGGYIHDIDSKGRSKTMWQKATAHKVDIVLSGHDHLYERFATQNASGQQAPDGTRQFTVGTGGKSHYSRTLTDAALNSEKIIDDQYGVLVLDLHENRYDWQFINVEGRTLDWGTQQCNE